MPKSPARAARHARRIAKAKLEKKMDKDAPPVPPLPPIPESLRSTLTPKGLAKLFERKKGRPQSDEAGPLLPSAGGPPGQNATISAAFSRGKSRPPLKTQFSNPELRSPGRLKTLPTAPSADEAGKLSGIFPAETTSPTIAFPEAPYVRVQKSNARYRLAPPRLSPMEYTRMCLVEKAQAEREGRPCELPAPEKLWRWTPNWESFLIVPVVPPSINRNFAQIMPLPDCEQDENGSDADSTTTLTLDTPTMPCPRLSLNLGGMTAFFPSVMNLARLGMSGDADPPISSSEAYVNHQLRRSRSFTVCRSTSLTSIAEEYPQEDDVLLQTPPSDKDGGSTGGSQSASISHSSVTPTQQDHGTGPELPVNSPEPEQEDAGGKDGGNESPQEAPTGTPSRTHGQSVPYDSAGTMAWLDKAESSSLYSDCSAKTAVRVGVQELRPKSDRSDIVFTPTSSPDVRSRAGLSPSRSTILSPALERPVLEYSPASVSASMSLSSIREAASPLARFSASSPRRGPTHDTPVFAKQRVRADGGNLRAKEPRQAMLVQSTISGRVKSTAADVCTMESGVAMVPDLQPAPLKVRKQRSPPAKDEAERCSRMWQGLSDEINEKLAEFARYEKGKVNDEKLLERSAQLGPLTPLEATKVRHISLEREEELAKWLGTLDTEQTKPKPQRSASALITPVQARFAFKKVRTPSFTIADSKEPSGFTPRHRKPGVTQAAIPDSPTLPRFECSFEDGEGKSGSESIAGRRRGDKRSALLPSNIPRPMEASKPLESSTMTGSTKAGPRTSAGPRGSSVSTPAKRLASNDSSFMLDESKDEDSVTILPKVKEKPTDGCRGRHGHATTTSVMPRSYFDHSPDRKVKKKSSAINALTPLAFQRFDTAARLASALTRRDFSGNMSPPPDKEVKPGRAPSSTFGNLFRKYSRTKMDDSEPATPKSPSGPAVHWKPFEETREHPAESWMPGKADKKRRETSTIPEHVRDDTKPQDQMRPMAPSGSHSHNNSGGSSSGAAGFKDKMKRRMAPQAGRKSSSEESAGFNSFIDDTLPPPPTSPLPPVPPLPSTMSELKGPAYKAKKPLGLWVDTGAAGKKPPKGGKPKEAARSSRNAGGGGGGTGVATNRP